MDRQLVEVVDSDGTERVLTLHPVSVAAAIVDDIGQALLIKRRHNERWEPPGGVLELDEDITAGLRREAREETGLDVEPVALTGVDKNMRRGIVALVFKCKATGGQLTLNDEVSEFRWATPDEITAIVDEAFAVRIVDPLSGRSTPAVRHHDGVRLT